MRFFKKTDIFIILFILIAAAVIFVFYKTQNKNKPAIAKIYYMSELVETIELNTKENKIFSIPSKENVKFHLYTDGSIAFVESDCSDKVCINTGKINTVGETAACLPNGLLVKIDSSGGGNSEDSDIVVGR